MGSFNYTKLHFFNKYGHELPLIYDSNFKIKFPGQFNEDSIFYAVTDSSKNVIDYYAHTIGGRCTNELVQPAIVSFNNVIYNTNIGVEIDDLTAASSYSDDNTYKYIKGITSEIELPAGEVLSYPSISFSSSLTFDKVSTELVETNTLYILVEQNGEFKKLDSTISEFSEWASRYKLLFFIDTRSQEDFRFFNSSEDNTDEIVWSNKAVISFDNSQTEFLSSIKNISDYRIDIGFKASEEGVFEEDLVVCLIDTYLNEDTDEFIQPIGVIKLHGEAIGEDERYRALFQNFGLPHPSEYPEVFANSNNSEDLVDNIELNENTKRLFLAYSEIFPYIGSYKALINAVNALGYNDLLFKEWYKETGKTHNRNIAFDISYNNDNVINTIKNLSFNDRIKLKKLNWLSLIYKINDISKEQGEDYYGFPVVNNVHGYNNNDLAVKLIALKEWLEKYIIGLNCRIIDVGGEGVYFERYKIDVYGTYQTILEYGKSINIAPKIVTQYISDDNQIKEYNRVISDISDGVNIHVNLGVETNNLTIEDLKDAHYIDFCDGYFIGNEYHEISEPYDELDSSLLFVGGSINCLTPLKSYTLKGYSSSESFLFGSKFVYKEVEDIPLPSLLLQNNTLIFNPIDLYNGCPKTVIFKKNPVIKINNGKICELDSTGKVSILSSISPSSANELLIPNTSNLPDPTVVTDESVEEHLEINVNSKVFTKVKDSNRLKYSADNSLSIPLLEIPVNIYNLPSTSSLTSICFLDILDGTIVFYDDNKTINLNFSIDNNGERRIRVNFVYFSDEYSVVKYLNGEDEITSFESGEEYADFVQAYLNSDESAIPIISSFEVPLCVNNTGEFSIDVIGKDWQNNIYGAKCINSTRVCLPEIGITSYTNEEQASVLQTQPEDINADANIFDDFTHFCIFDYKPLISDISVSRQLIKDSYYHDSKYSVSYPNYSYAFSNPKENSILQFTNAKYKFDINAIDFETSLFNNSSSSTAYSSFGLIGNPVNTPDRKFINNNELGKEQVVSSYNGLFAAFDERLSTESYRPLSTTTPDPNLCKIYTAAEYLKRFSDSRNTFSDITLTFINELGGYPLAQMYGQMAADKCFYNEPSSFSGLDAYRIVSTDDTHKGYVYVSLQETADLKIKEEFAACINKWFNDETSELTSFKFIIESLIASEDTTDDEALNDEASSDLNAPENEEISSIIPELSISSYDETVAYNIGWKLRDILAELKDNSLYNISYGDVDEYTKICSYDSDTLDSILNVSPFTDIIINSDQTILNTHLESYALYPVIFNYVDSSLSNYKLLSYDTSTYNLLNDISNIYLYSSYEDNKESFIETGLTYVNLKYSNDDSLDFKSISERIFSPALHHVIATSLVNDTPVEITLKEVIERFIRIDFVYNDNIIKDIIPLVYNELYKLTECADITVNTYQTIVANLFTTLCIKSEDFTMLDNKDDVENNGQTAYSRIIELLNSINIPSDDIDTQILSVWQVFSGICIEEGVNLLNALNDETQEGEVSSPGETTTPEQYKAYLSILFSLYSYFAVAYLINVKAIISNNVSSNDKLKLFNIKNLLFDYLSLTEIDLQSHVILMCKSFIKSLNETFYISEDNQTTVDDEDETTGTDVASNKIYKFISEHSFDKDNSDINETSIYNKVLSGFINEIYTSFINSEMAGEIVSIGSVSSNTDENLDNITDLKYAVTYKDDKSDKRYYVKTASCKFNGLSYVGEKHPDNFISVNTLLNNSYTSVYVNSTRKDKIYISKLSNKDENAVVTNTNGTQIIKKNITSDNFDNIFISFVNDNELPIEYKQAIADNLFYIKFENKEYRDFYKPGEKIKLICESFISKEIIGQATYTVIGKIDPKLDSDNKPISTDTLLLFGGITKEYFNTADINVYYKGLDSDNKESVFQVYSFKITDNMISEATGAFDVANFEYASYFRNMYPVHVLSNSTDEQVNMYISPAHHSYVNYKLKISDVSINKTENDTELSNINIGIKDDNFPVSRIMDFVDDTFSIQISSYDINNGISGWMNYTVSEETLTVNSGEDDNETTQQQTHIKYTPEILDSSIYKFSNCPLRLKETNNVVISPLFDISDNNSYIKFWKIFRTDPVSGERILFFESYNPSLYLDISKEGCYDIELTVFDEYGNSTTKMFNGAISII